MHLLYAAERQTDAYLVKALREAGHLVEALGGMADVADAAAGGEYQAIVLDCAAPDAVQAALACVAACDVLLLAIIEAASAADRATLLNAGVDTCFVRPVSVIELTLRLEALAGLVRRGQAPDGAEMLAAERAVRLNGRKVPLSPREFRLMQHLTGHAGEVMDLDRLQQYGWGDVAEPRPEVVRTCMARLRRKLAAAGAAGFLLSIAGHGYVFQKTPVA